MSPIPMDAAFQAALKPGNGIRPTVPGFVRVLRDILLYESGPGGVASPNIAAWICGPEFTTCIAHSELALDVFRAQVAVHPLDQVFDYVAGGWDLSPAMAMLPFYVTIKELLRGKSFASVEPGREGRNLASPMSLDEISNGELAAHDNNLQAFIERTGKYVNSMVRLVSELDRKWSKAAAHIRLMHRLFTAVLNSSTIDELEQRWGLILDHAGTRWRMLASEVEEPTLELPFAKGAEGVDELMPKCLE
ncbi:hypothetical protein M427DRAFT_63474 [Gonapodya prolifera JEL478]|uniref:Uncharacterized protein n=1 Tax=Gonapodya prolifera (strain JEL478) TaxID=1344416 RepID=A0A138ZZ79_GONPJ|nr:hypothetical protein M427DRAFT_63474 [Gonapodya prolifera JEL478]|eukprot:KXS09816.1 hypothetical protein M427DRAFT_63474 [Gonapodya prolifera JEL478]